MRAVAALLNPAFARGGLPEALLRAAVAFPDPNFAQAVSGKHVRSDPQRFPGFASARGDAPQAVQRAAVA